MSSVQGRFITFEGGEGVGRLDLVVHVGHPGAVEEQDRVDSANLYQVLTSEVIPMFYNRDAHGIPRQWIKRIRNSMATVVPQYSSHRQVREYVEKYYLPGKA